MNEVHPTAIIDGDVRLGQGNRILPYSVLIGPLDIGDDNTIGPHVVIGTPGQSRDHTNEDLSSKLIRIGDRNIIREFTAVQKPVEGDLTEVGNDVFLMQSVHIPHDAVLEDEVIITPMAVLAGVTRVMRAANIGMGSTIHQFSVIGPYSMIATNAPVVKNVKPFSKLIPGKPVTTNSYAVRRFGFADHAEEIDAYVLSDEAPTSEPVRSVVERYLQLHQASGRPQY